MQSRFSVVIPAAGLSARMGRDKALLLRPDGRTFADYLVGCYLEADCDPVILVVNEQFDPDLLKSKGFTRIINGNLELGRSHSIHLGLQLIPVGRSCFIHNIDNPFTEKQLIGKMILAGRDDAYVVPLWGGRRGHPVLLGKNVTDYFRFQVPAPEFREGLKIFSRIEVEFPDPQILWNINTPEDYRRYRQESGSFPKKM